MAIIRPAQLCLPRDELIQLQALQIQNPRARLIKNKLDTHMSPFEAPVATTERCELTTSTVIS